MSSAHEIMQPSMWLLMDWPQLEVIHISRVKLHVQWWKNEVKWHEKKKDAFVIFHSVVFLSDILLLSWRRKSFCLNRSTDYALVYVRYQGAVILGAQTVIEWMGVKRRWGEQTDKRATSALEQQQLNSRLQIDFPQAFQMIFFFYTHAHTNTDMHSLTLLETDKV